jgi:hypothetical protein
MVTITVSCGGGTAAEQFTFGMPAQTLAAMNVAAGDYVYAEADILWSGLANVNQLALRLQQTTSDAAPNNQIFAYVGGPNGYLLPTGTQMLATTPGFVPLRTPPMRIETTATSLSWGLDFGFKADGAAGSAAAVLKIANFALRKAKVV